MKRKFTIALACAGCFMVPSCVVDQDALIDLGKNLLCDIATSDLPFGDHVDYCSFVDLDLGE